MLRIFIGLESSSTLNFVSERDPDEIVQTHMLSLAFADHIYHTFQQGLCQLIWGSVQVNSMLGSELCSRKEHAHRVIEEPCRTRLGHCAELGNPLKCLKGRGGEGCQSHTYLSLKLTVMYRE